MISADCARAVSSWSASYNAETRWRYPKTPKHGVDRIARGCGFGDEERMRTTFQRHLAISPRDYRRRFSTRLLTAAANEQQEI
jgi:AraC-like DNA-binding protein